MRKLVSGFVVMAAVALLPGMASARPPYGGAFTKAYEVKPESNLAKAKCDLCHSPTDKKVRNLYGKDLEKALGKTGASPEEVTVALKKIEEMKAADKKTKYIELIKADKLPGAEEKKAQ